MNVEEFYKTVLNDLKSQGRERKFNKIKQNGKYIFDKNNRKLLNLQSNDYLAIGARGDFRNDIAKMLSEGNLSMGSYSSRLLSGNNQIYDELEYIMQNRFGKSVLLFNSGYHMNTGVLSALTTENTVIIADKLVHASIIDGMKLCSCKFERFRHNDLNHLEKIVHKHKDCNDIIIVVESLYSMDGDMADLKGLVELKKKYTQIRLYVDEAHSIGCMGQTGLGLAEETGTIQDIDLLAGTFGKTFASMGGYIVSNDITKKYLIQRCRSLIFSTALPPVTMFFNKLVFENLDSYQTEREKLYEISRKLKQLLSTSGIETSSNSHIIPIILGSDNNAIKMSEILMHEGFFVLPVRPPSVAEGTSRIRLSLTSETDDIENLVSVIKSGISNI